MASHSASKGMAVFVTGIVFLVLAALSVVFRLVARVGYLKNAGSDDAAIVIALVCLTQFLRSTSAHVPYQLACIALIVATCIRKFDESS